MARSDDSWRRVRFLAEFLTFAYAAVTSRSLYDPHTIAPTSESHTMIILGLILLLVGLFVKGLAVLITIGVIILAVGLVLAVLGATGRAIGGRKHYF